MSTATSTTACGHDAIPARPWTASALDWAERGAVLALYAWLVARVVASGAFADGGLVNVVFLTSEGLVVLFMVIRRSTNNVSRCPSEWLLAAAATTAPLLASPAPGRALLPPILAGLLMFAGLLVQMHAKLVLGRSMGCVPAHRGLKFSGPYRFVRHPMYAGYLLSHVAFWLLNATPWNLAVYVACYAAQVPRMLQEERLLKRDTHYAEYMTSVRYRLIPGVF